MQFYTRGEDGNYAEATQDQIEGLFKPRYDRFKQSESAKIRDEVTESVRKELTPTLTDELRKQLDDEYKPKLDEANNKVKQLDIQVRQKTIAAEYGFKPGTEKYLGEGTDDEMRKEADDLKDHFGSTFNAPAKKTSNGESDVQKSTGVKVDI